MVKKKKQTLQFHKIKIHYNRWLIWAIVYVILVAIALVGYIKISDINIDSENTAATQFQSFHRFTDQKLGFYTNLPFDWSIETVDANNINFAPVNNSDEGVSVFVLSPSAENSLRKTLTIKSESASKLDASPAETITNDLGSGHTETVILATHNLQLYVIRGTSDLVQKFALIFHFIR
jgi:hypothetical protein